MSPLNTPLGDVMEPPIHAEKGLVIVRLSPGLSECRSVELCRSSVEVVSRAVSVDTLSECRGVSRAVSGVCRGSVNAP